MKLKDKMNDYSNAIAPVRFKCQCGHVMTIPIFREKTCCSWCGHFVYRTPKLEFKDRLISAIKRGRRIETIL